MKRANAVLNCRACNQTVELILGATLSADQCFDSPGMVEILTAHERTSPGCKRAGVSVMAGPVSPENYASLSAAITVERSA